MSSLPQEQVWTLSEQQGWRRLSLLASQYRPDTRAGSAEIGLNPMRQREAIAAYIQQIHGLWVCEKLQECNDLSDQELAAFWNISDGVQGSAGNSGHPACIFR